MTARKTKTTAKQAETAFKAGAETIEKAMAAGKESADKLARFGSEAMTTGYDQAMAMAKEQVKTYFPAALKSFEEIAAFNKANVEALMAAGSVTASGVEAVTKQAYDFNRTSLEQGMGRTAAFAQCKSLTDVIELQLEIARDQFDAMVSESAKLSEMTAKVASEALQPVAGRMTDAMGRAFKPVAA